MKYPYILNTLQFLYEIPLHIKCLRNVKADHQIDKVEFKTTIFRIKEIEKYNNRSVTATQEMF